MYLWMSYGSWNSNSLCLPNAKYTSRGRESQKTVISWLPCLYAANIFLCVWTIMSKDVERCIKLSRNFKPLCTKTTNPSKNDWIAWGYEHHVMYVWKKCFQQIFLMWWHTCWYSWLMTYIFVGPYMPAKCIIWKGIWRHWGTMFKIVQDLKPIWLKNLP